MDAATNIQLAVNAAGSGDRVLVASGHYSISAPIMLTNALALCGISGAMHAIVDASNAVRCLTISSGGALVAGLTFMGGYDPHLGGGILSEVESTISNCVITDCHADWGGGVFLQGAGTLISCRVEDNTALTAGGIACLGDVRVESTLVRANEANGGAGIECGYGPGYGAPEIVNCTITGNAAEEMGGGIYFNLIDFDPDPIPTPLVLNTIIYHNQADAFPETDEYGGNDSHVNFWTCCLRPFPPRFHLGNITNDPQLTPSYRLKSSSPCIDSGTSADAPPADIDGEARWDHPDHSNAVSIVDIGADEFVDADSDDMADHWENETFGGTTNSNGTTDGDNDALFDLDEYESGTAPNNADTDADRMPDGWEVGNALDPLTNDADQDPDADTLNNGGEYVADTDPHDPQTVLSVINVAAEQGGTRLDWQGGRDAWQFLEASSDLLDPSGWTPIYALPPPPPVTNAVIHFGVTNRSFFYRIRAAR